MPNQQGLGYYVDLTNSADNYVADTAEALAIKAAHPDLVWSGVNAQDGADTIHRDRSGGYALEGQPVFGAMTINGGAGGDVVNYSLAISALDADLETGNGKIEDAGGKVYEFDNYESIEGITGTHYDDNIYGDGGNNLFNGLNGEDVIEGGAGIDVINGGNGADDLYGGDDMDVISGGNDDDNIWGENGNDSIDGDGGADNIHGGAGADTINGGSGNDTISGGGGSDTINGGGDNDTIDGDAGNDVIDGGEGSDVMDGGYGNDTIHLNGNDVAFGGIGKDTFVVANGWGDNEIDGGSGHDTVRYVGDDDVQVYLYDDNATRGSYQDELISIASVETDGGDDTVFGTVNYNKIETGSGSDTIYTLGGDDFVDGGGGSDTIVGYGGDETLNGGSGADTIHGDSGEDEIDGGLGNDIIDAGGDDDIVFGGSGNDDILGGSGNDTIDGEFGFDDIDGGAGDDTIDGGLHADRITGGEGFDVMSGGAGADTFVYNHGDTLNAIDVLTDFQGGSDFLAFGEGFFELNGVGITTLDDVLNAYNGFDGTVIEARTADQGWQPIAVVSNAGQTDAINDRIEDGTLANEADLGNTVEFAPTGLTGGRGDGSGGDIGSLAGNSTNVISHDVGAEIGVLV